MMGTNKLDDERGKLLEITPEGLNEINAVRSRLQKIDPFVTSDLGGRQKKDVIRYASTLHEFHQPLFEAKDEKLLHERLGIKE